MPRLTRGLAAAVLLWGTTPSPALAQFLQRAPAGRADPPCVLDKCLDPGGSAPATPAPRPAGGPSSVSPGAFDFYVLALSWSPGFCDTGGAQKGGDQCAPGAGLGFVVHGLWPQNTRGYPSGCDTTARSPTRAALDATRGLYPSIGLAVHEWREHGTCTGLGPVDYFAAVRRARAAVTIPPARDAPREPQTLRPADIRRAFTASNPGLRADTMAVTCRQGETAGGPPVLHQGPARLHPMPRSRPCGLPRRLDQRPSGAVAPGRPTRRRRPKLRDDKPPSTLRPIPLTASAESA